MNGQMQIVIGAVIGFAVIAAWFFFVPDLFVNPDASSTSFERFGLGLRWVLIAQLPLIVGIVTVSQQRFWSDKQADGSAPDIGTPLEINRRYLTNTLEQTALATLGILALSITVPVDRMNFVPTAVLLFVFGRICFWIGYHINSYTRGFGLVLTLVPTMGIYVYVLRESF